MVISGALSGIGGGIYYLAGTGQSLEKSILGMGFNGIPVALLASSNPIGTILRRSLSAISRRRCLHAARLLVRDH